MNNSGGIKEQDRLNKIVIDKNIKKPEFLTMFITSLDNIHNQEEAEMSNIESVMKSVAQKAHDISIKNEIQLKAKKDRFNILNCLTRHHLEELHSRFLHYLLEPKETHDCGDLFLSLFIETLKENEEIKERLSAINISLSDASASREKFIGRSNESDIYGFIDIFIKTSTLNIAIENKITAGEQPKQIERYSSFCENLNKDFIVVYLTLTGNHSEQSGGKLYFSISYQKDINSWLDKCLEKTCDFPLIHTGIYYYKELLNKKVLYNPSNSITMEMKEFLLKEENKLFLKYWGEIDAARIPVRNHLRVEFFKKVSDILLKKGYNFSSVREIVNPIKVESIWDKPNRGFIFNDEKFIYNLDEKHKLFFTIEHNWDDLGFGLFGVKQDENNGRHIFEYTTIMKDNNILENISNHIDGVYSLGYWLCRKDFNVLNKGLKFYSDALNYDFSTQMNELVTAFIEQVEEYLSVWERVIQGSKSL